VIYFKDMYMYLLCISFIIARNKLLIYFLCLIWFFNVIYKAKVTQGLFNKLSITSKKILKSLLTSINFKENFI